MGDSENLTRSPSLTSSSQNGSGVDNVAFDNPFAKQPVRITYILLYSAVFAMCFIGNIIVLIVFAYSKRMRTRTNLFLANLAVADFCVGVFCVLPNLSIRLSSVWTFGRVMCKLHFFVNDMSYTASVLLLVVIAVERYIAIMHPLRSRGFFTAPRLIVAQMVVWVVAAVYNIPVLLMFDTMTTPTGDYYCFMTSPFMNMPAYYTVHFTLWYLLPLTVILAMYGRISCTLWTTSALPLPHQYRSQGRASSLTVVPDPISTQVTAAGGTAKRGGGGCCVSTAARTCVSYCDPTGSGDGYDSVIVSVGPHDQLIMIGDPGRAVNGLDGAGRGSSPSMSRLLNGPADQSVLKSCLGGGGESAGGGDGTMTSKLGESEMALMQCLLASPSPSPKAARNTVVAQPREINGQVEMVTLRFNSSCADCFNCLHHYHTGSRDSAGAAGAGGTEGRLVSPGSYSPRRDLAAAVSPYGRESQRPQRRRWTSSDDYAYEMSDVNSSEDYDPPRGGRSGKEVGGGEAGVGSRPARVSSGGGIGIGSSGGAVVERERDAGGLYAFGAAGLGGAAGTGRRPRAQYRINSQRGLTSRRRVIRLLLAVVTIFALCVLPFHLRNLLHYWNVNPEGGLFDFLSPMASVMMYLNCGLNPFIYWMFSDHFRRSLRETVCVWKKTRRTSSRFILNSPNRRTRN